MRPADLSRIEAGRGAPSGAHQRDHLDTDGAGRGAAARRGTRAYTRIDVPSGLPDVLADRQQIERVLSNLMSNAVRHTTQGDEIAVTVTPHEEYVAVAVTDTGSGIPPEYLPRIFEKFVQVPNAPSGGRTWARHLETSHRGAWRADQCAPEVGMDNVYLYLASGRCSTRP